MNCVVKNHSLISLYFVQNTDGTNLLEFPKTNQKFDSFFLFDQLPTTGVHGKGVKTLCGITTGEPYIKKDVINIHIRLILRWYSGFSNPSTLSFTQCFFTELFRSVVNINIHVLDEYINR